MMKTTTMQRIDRAFGPILGSILVALRQILPRRKKSGADNIPVKNILILKFLGIGTLLLASPALRRLKAMNPSARIVILTLSQNQALAEMLPGLEEVVVIKIDNFRNLLKSLCGVLPGLIKRKFDAVVDLEFFANFPALITACLTLFNPDIVAAGYDFPGHWRNKVYGRRVVFHHKKHISEIMSDLINSLLLHAAEPEKISFDVERRIFFEKAQTDLVTESQDKYPHSPAFVVTLNINSGDMCENRRWPKGHFREVVAELQKRKNIAIFLIGGSSDVAYVDEFLKSLPSQENVVSFCGKTSFYQLLGILAKTDLFITNDSGPLHLATVMAIPTIAFFGPETPALYGPVGERSHVFYRDLPCSPCLSIYNSKYYICHDNQCMKTITSAQVMKVVDAEINTTKARKP